MDITLGLSLPVDIVLYLLITTGIVFVGIFVSFLADQLQNKTKMSAALVSGVFLGILSGIPEIVADLTTVFIKKPQLAVGDIIGSNLINISLLAIASLIFIKNIRKFKSTRADFINLGSLVLMHILFVAGFFTDGIVLINHVLSIISLIAFIIYIVNVYFMCKETHHASHSSHNLIFKLEFNLKKIIIWFIIGGVVLAGLSIALVIISHDIIDGHMGGHDSFGASIFLGIATSLSEAIAVFTLLYLKNAPAAVSHILGTNLFNIFVLALVDAIKGKASGNYDLFANDPASTSVTIGALVLIVLLGVLMIWHQYKVKRIHLTMRNISSISLLTIMSLGYFVYLTYSGLVIYNH